MKSDCALLVPSCDAYADVWPLFLHGLKRYWPDCPFPVYFGTNECSDVSPDVVTLRSGEGLCWSNRLIDYLLRIEQPYVLLLLEDFILRDAVPTTVVQQALALCRAEQLDCFRLIPRPPPATSRGRGRWCAEVLPSESYRLSTQAAIWRRDYLLSLLRRGESIWQFEMDGTQRAARAPGRIWSVYQAVLPYEGWLAHHVIEKGRWIPHERWILRARGYPLGAPTRASMTPFQVFCYQFGESTVRLSRFVGEVRVARLRAALRALLPREFERRYQNARSAKK